MIVTSSQQFAATPLVRLRPRRLSQGCAILLLLPTAAAFLPVQGRAPQKPLSLVPVTPQPITLAPAAPVATATVHQPTHKASRLSGIASWYGNVLRGHHTASGERFDPDALTACHPTLPFGTLVKVINLLNHKSVTVRINDRGVLFPNRVIDLSSAAAEQIDMLRAGVAPVRLEVQKTLQGKPEAEHTAPAAPAMQSPVAEVR